MWEGDGEKECDLRVTFESVTLAGLSSSCLRSDADTSPANSLPPLREWMCLWCVTAQIGAQAQMYWQKRGGMGCGSMCCAASDESFMLAASLTYSPHIISL